MRDAAATPRPDVGGLAGLAAIVALLACGGSAAAPAPTPAEPPPPPAPVAAKRTGPPPRGGTQQSPEAIEATLTAAAELREAGQLSAAIEALAPCANKAPPSPRCDGEVGMLYARLRTAPKLTAYYLDEAAARDDPKADLQWWRDLAAVAQRVGRHDAAANAYAYALTRDGDHLHDWIGRSEAFQAANGRVNEAIVALDEAIELAPQRHDLWFDKATLLALTADQSAALEAFEHFLTIVPADHPTAEIARDRVPQIRARLGLPEAPAAPAETESAAP